MKASGTDRRKTDREEVRAYLTAKVAEFRAKANNPRYFSSYPPTLLADDAEFRLRWLDCAPVGARFCVAPMQDKNGVPCGDAWREDVGPSKAVRVASEKRFGMSYAAKKLEVWNLEHGGLAS